MKLTTEELRAKRSKPVETWGEISNAYAVCYLAEIDGKLIAHGYTGRKTKPSFRYRFANSEQRAKHCANFLDQIAASNKVHEQWKADNKAKGNKFQVGDVLVCSWGYDQTNIDFYQVTKRSAACVWLREIKATCERNGQYMTGTSMPVLDCFDGGEFRRVVKGDYVKIKSYSVASKWDGRPEQFTEYA